MLSVRTVLMRDESYSNYRIPGTVITKAGTVLTYFEARRTAGDWALMDILLYRSEDGGKTFSAPLTMAEGTEQFPTVNNPVCIVGRDTILHFIYCRNYAVVGASVFIENLAVCSDGAFTVKGGSFTASCGPNTANGKAVGAKTIDFGKAKITADADAKGTDASYTDQKYVKAVY